MLQQAMAFRGTTISPLSHLHRNFLIVQCLRRIPLSPLPRSPSPPLSSPQFSCNPSSSDIKWSEILPVNIGRRMVNLSIVEILLYFENPFSRFSFYPKAMAAEVLELDKYTDSKEGFTLLVPSSWNKVDKAGATVLFEDANKKANNIGVVVSPTRISSLGEFGTPQFVADKLIQAERRKESTKEAEVISSNERSGHGGLQVYEIEYKLDSTRGGMKRVFSAAFVASKKLYLLNITQSDNSENPIDTESRMILEQILHSFDATPST